MRENREILSSLAADGAAGRIGKAGGRNPMMNDERKSDRSVVPAKPSNKSGRLEAEMVEGRDLAKGNTSGQNAVRTQRRAAVHNALDRVRQAARRDKKQKFTALLHHVTVERLRDAFLHLKRKAAPGIDRVTWDQYSEDLEARLQALHGRIHRGAYRPKPSRRAFIPKPDGRQRPLGIAALEDKIVQKAVVDVMNAIYEEDFIGFSYGFRPGRSQHDALDALYVGIYTRKVNYVLDADIRGFFDAIDHEWLMKFIEHRIADPRVLRLIRKWLKAGVVEGGQRTMSEEGTPQGATVSPLLANIYLHYVFDLWAERWRRRHARGEITIVRYADDFIVGFRYHTDAVRFLAELRERFRSFALELHPEKTRLIDFGIFAIPRRFERHQKGKPETFTFLGLTHICGKSREGKFLLMRHTARSRMRDKLKEIRGELYRRRHLPIPEQGRWIGSVVRGYYAYYAVPTNVHKMQEFRTQVERHWRFALKRRSQRDRTTWDNIRRISARWIPSPRVLHPYPFERFDRRTRGKSPVR